VILLWKQPITNSGKSPSKFEWLSVALKISVGSVRKELGFNRVCACWVSHQLMCKMKQICLNTCQALLAHYEAEGDDYLGWIMTCTNSRMNPNELVRSGTIYTSLKPKHFWAVPSPGKVMFTVFWDMMQKRHHNKQRNISQVLYLKTKTMWVDCCARVSVCSHNIQ
jgi:hypothetical protein